MSLARFLEWYEDQPEGRHYELMGGLVYAMAAERLAHSLMKFRIARQLYAAVRHAGLPCTVFPDGTALSVGQDYFEPDGMVYCGPPIDLTAVILPEATVVVEVGSPSTSRIDSVYKLPRYFDLPALHHYLLVQVEPTHAVLHSRRPEGGIGTKIIRSEPIPLDPPGIVLDRWWTDD